MPLVRAACLAVVLGVAAVAHAAPDTTAAIDALETELEAREQANDKLGQARILRSLYAAQRQLSGEGHVLTERRKLALAGVLNDVGAHAEAIGLYKELLAAAEKQHGPDSDEVHQALGWLIGAHWSKFDTQPLVPLFERKLAITKKRHGETSTRYAGELGYYAGFLETQGELVAAERLYQQALKIEEAAGQDISGRLTSLGLLHLNMHDYTRAQATFDRYVALLEKQPLERRITMLGWIGMVYRVSPSNRPDLAAPYTRKAIQLGEQELQRIEKQSGATAQALLPTLQSIGWMYKELGDLANAQRVIEREVALQEKYGQLPMYAALASVRRDQGRAKEAYALFEKQNAATAKLRSPAGTGLYPMMADIQRELGNYKLAEQLYTTAQADLDKQFGKRAVLVMRLHLGLFAVHVAAGQTAKAERVLAENLELGERELAAVLATGTEADHVAYFTREQIQLDTALSFHAANPGSASIAKLALTTILRRKGRVMDASAANLAMLRAKLSADDKALLDKLDDARGKLAKLAVAGAPASKDFAKEVAELEDEIKKLEVTLGKRSAEYRVARQPIELAAIQAKLPKDARLVEIVNYQPRDPKAKYTAKPVLAPRRYAAYVLAATGTPTRIDLGPAQPIDDAVAKLRAAVADPHNARVATLAKALDDLTFAKLVRSLGGARHVMLAPDGALNLVPFAALFDGVQYRVKAYTFTYLTSGRDVLRLGARAPSRGPALIFADPDFDTTKSAPPAAARGRRSRAMTGLYWGRLPGTGQEADAIAKSLAGATIYRDALATENALKSVHAPPVLHLATHGFFLADAATTGDATENPLLRSGLVFAGANQRGTGDQDGVLTALEASGLDLWGTRLVVMSACETGVGTATNGEGVYGLRRALVIAGAESLVMSLWQVDDLATRDLMAGYYRRLQSGAGRSAGLRDVQLELLGNGKYAHPYYWASFVPAGDSSPL